MLNYFITILSHFNIMLSYFFKLLVSILLVHHFFIATMLSRYSFAIVLSYFLISTVLSHFLITTVLSHFSLRPCSVIPCCYNAQSFSTAPVLNYSSCYNAQSLIVVIMLNHFHYKRCLAIPQCYSARSLLVAIVSSHSSWGCSVILHWTHRLGRGGSRVRGTELRVRTRLARSVWVDRWV
jgi:hypothetical protein